LFCLTYWLVFLAAQSSRGMASTAAQGRWFSKKFPVRF
jgi:hypothetical protein